ncbi:MAG: hypothetical protein QHH14_11335 [Clostridiales bacterium]|jgi:hypothetical protein|nr:hypothetical protein [Clostridiales bacterium]
MRLSRYLRGWLRKKGVAKFYFDTQKINKEIGLIKINGRIFEKIDDLKFRPRFDYLKFEKCEPIAVLIIKDILFILIKTEHKGQEYFIYIDPITGFCLCDDYSKTIEVATIMAVNQILKYAPGNNVEDNCREIKNFILGVLSDYELNPAYKEGQKK